MATIDQVRDAMHSVPFVPFSVRLVDGRSFTVRHPDFISVPSHLRGRSVVIHEDRRVNHIDIPLVDSIDHPDTADVESSSEGNGA